MQNAHRFVTGIFSPFYTIFTIQNLYSNRFNKKFKKSRIKSMYLSKSQAIVRIRGVSKEYNHLGLKPVKVRCILNVSERMYDLHEWVNVLFWQIKYFWHNHHYTHNTMWITNARILILYSLQIIIHCVKTVAPINSNYFV